jgi:PKD repeat protein
MYSTIPINGQEITLIYVKQQNGLALSRLHLSEIVYIYYEEKAEKDLGDAQSCQVNINCSPEGDNWQVQKRGVARISFREGSSWYLCSGTLINNTANDGTPYFLTAYHCGGNASAADRNVWQFYFNYERPGCSNTGTPPNNVITGCTYKAGGDIDGGSDFQLLLLSSSPSLSWNPYYNGWSRSTTASPSGVGIHHPSGDAKKISTYTQTLGTGSWSGGMSSAHWTVKWAQTTNGWGVTEGGSSGSPIFDNNKRVVGTLTGGSSDCSNQTTAKDYYGKFSKHWDANGTSNDKKLQPWLDPLGTNPTTLDGYDPNNPSGVNNPQNFVATSISQSQINLSWSLNSSNNPVLLVYNTTNTFGTPTNGTNYNVGQTIPGGGTVIYKGANTSFAHTGLNAGTTYYYKIFSIATGNDYSSGVTAQATTWWQGAGFSLDFEACADWSTDFTPWTSYDGDGKDTYGSSDCDFTGEGTAFGFMAFNPSLAGCFSTHGGQRCGVSICPADATESNDWIISPQIQMNNNGSISFWVYSPKPSTWGEETYDVLVSTTNNQPASFTPIATDEIAPTSWTQKTYSLSAYNNQAIYVAIRHKAADKFMMMIDDIVIDTGTVSSTNPLNFTATAISQSQIDLSWSLNSSNNPVLLVYNTTNTFGTPTNGTNYNVGQTIPGGGTVIYNGSNTTFPHTGLNSNTTYYYKIFSIMTGNTYSTGVTDQATTLPEPISGFSLDFEACADWSTDFAPWTSYDGDGKTTYQSADCDFTGEGTAFGFMAFNPSLAGCFSTHGGDRCGVSICPSDASESNDLIISPQIQMRNNGSISFWVYSPKPSTWGEETYDVLVSTTNNQPASFTAIATDEIAPTSWTQKTYSLSTYNNQIIYVAIRHKAADKFMMMIDDIVIDTGTVSSTNPVASFTYSPSNICQGSQVQFTNTSQNATSYSWSFPGGNPSTSTQDNSVVTFNTAGNINVTLIAFNGTISDTIIQQITVYPLPNVSASANPTSICVGGSSILSASGADTYNWSNGMTGSQITVSPTTTTTYTVTGTSTAGCTNTATVMVNINTSIDITATANPSDICVGGNTELTASGASSYSWSNGMTGATITVSPTSTTTYSVTGSSGGCTGTTTVSVTINPLPNVSASANPTSICVGDSSIIIASGAATYIWSNGMTGSQITVSPATSSTYTVTGTNLNGCTNTATFSITVNALPTININANPQSICIGNSTILSASGATTYNWSNGMTGSQTTVSPSSSTIYTVTGTNSSNCSNTATISVTVETMPSAGTISTSNPQLCQNELLTLTLNDYSPNSNIQWQISTDGINWNDIAGATTSNYNYTFTSAGIYNFRAKVSNSCTSVYSDPIIITVNPLPTPGTASADTTTICQNNSVLLTLSGYSSGTTIQWQTSNDNFSWNNISGANSAVYNYTPTNAGTIYIRAQLTNDCGSAFSNSIIINVEAIPNGGNINTSSNTICQNDNVALILTGQTPMTSLQWQLSTDNSTWYNISGANTSNYNFIANNLGTYYFRVIVSNNCGTATSNVTSLTVNPIPPTPTISLISSYPPILYSNATTGNQWYNLNGAIQGATNQTYQVIENGTYYVIVTENNCQSLPSESITIDNVSIESYDNDDVIVYPIPASDMIYIQTNKNISELLLIDAIGRVVAISNDSQLNVSDLSNGVYQLLIKFENDRLIFPVIIEK